MIVVPAEISVVATDCEFPWSVISHKINSTGILLIIIELAAKIRCQKDALYLFGSYEITTDGDDLFKKLNRPSDKKIKNVKVIAV